MLQLAMTAGLVPRTNREIESLESKLLGLPQATYRLRTFHAPGIYLREITMPGGALIVGHEHITEHFNIVAKGSALVVNGETVERMVAPYVVMSGPGVRKVLLTLEETVWYTIHENPWGIRDEEDLERLLVKKSDTFTRHEQDIAEQALSRIDRNLIPTRK